MSRFLVVFTIIILICIIVALSAGLIIMLKNDNGFMFSFSVGETYNKILEEEYNIKDFDDLKLDYKIGNIYIKHSDDNKVKVIAYGKETDEIKCVIEDRKLIVEDFTNKGNELNPVNKRKIEVFLPEEYANTIDTITKAGNVNIEDFENAKLNIKTNAGNVTVGNAKTATITSDAGNINVSKIPDLKLETDAGNINVKEITKKCNITTDAGNIHISKLFVTETSTIDADMGNINIEETNDAYIEAKNSLGNVNVRNNTKDSNVKVYIKTDLGNIHVK